MCDASAPSRGARTIPRPRWGRLYGIVPLGLVALLTLEVVVPPGASRTLLQCGLVVGIFTAMAAWVGRNRMALDQQDWCDCAWEKTTMRVIPSRWPEPPARAAVAAALPLASAGRIDEKEEAWAESSGPH